MLNVVEHSIASPLTRDPDVFRPRVCQGPGRCPEHTRALGILDTGQVYPGPECTLNPVVFGSLFYLGPGFTRVPVVYRVPVYPCPGCARVPGIICARMYSGAGYTRVPVTHGTRLSFGPVHSQVFGMPLSLVYLGQQLAATPRTSP